MSALKTAQIVSLPPRRRTISIGRTCPSKVSIRGMRNTAENKSIPPVLFSIPAEAAFPHSGSGSSQAIAATTATVTMTLTNPRINPNCTAVVNGFSDTFPNSKDRTTEVACAWRKLIGFIVTIVSNWRVPLKVCNRSCRSIFFCYGVQIGAETGETESIDSMRTQNDIQVHAMARTCGVSKSGCWTWQSGLPPLYASSSAAKRGSARRMFEAQPSLRIAPVL